MTTMDSDSASQDSDDGRRFRFEATRKDATLISHSKHRDSQYSRSPGPSERNRRDNDKFSNRGRDSRSRHDSRHTSRDSDSKDRRDRHSVQKYLKDSKDAHDSKHLKHRDDKESKSSPIQKERDDREMKDSKDLRDSKDRKDSKSSRSNDKDSKNQRESTSSRDRNTKRSRDRSRSDRSLSDKHKLKCHEKHKSHSKDNHSKLKEDRVLEKSEKPEKVSVKVIHTDNNLSKEVTDSTQDGCREFNISDFEIVSDLEEFSSDSSNCSDSYRSKVRKRHIKQQSSQLSDGHSENKKHRIEELQKVNPRNGNHSTTSSNNNPSAFSDSSLDSALPTTSVSKNLKDEKTATKIIVESDTLCDFSFNEAIDKSNEEEKSLRFIDDNGEMSEIVTEDANEKQLIGPLLPSSNLIEDDLSSNKLGKFMSKKLQDEEPLEESSQGKTIGPILPAQFVSEEMEVDEDIFGPLLPPHLMKKVKNSEIRVFGPSLPSELKSDDIISAESDFDDDVIGPLPSDHPANKTSIVQQSLEFRAQRIQNELMAEPTNKNKKREEWMTELPPVQAVALGLGPRKFKMREGPDFSDRSSWTDTPTDKVRKQQEKAEERLAAIATEKETFEKLSVTKQETSEKLKKRPKTLLEIHQKKLKKKKKKEEKESREKGKSTRRPFDRDVDLESNRFDEAQKKHIFMKAQLLDDRFTQGKM